MNTEKPKTGQVASPSESIASQSVDSIAADSIAAREGETINPASHHASFGNQLRAAREARGLALEACASSLRLSPRVLRQLENGERDGIDHHIYLGSYISKYGRYLGIEETAIQTEIAKIKRNEPVLVATGGISHSRYLLERYATAATYLVLTAVIVVPMVWLGLRGTLDRDLAHLAPLDASPVAQQEVASNSSSTNMASTAAGSVTKQPDPPVVPVHVDPQPLVASMMPNLDNATAPTTSPATPDDDVEGAGAHALSLNLASPSWVEVIAKNGSRLEYGLLQPGSKIYRSDGPLDVRIGNASGAQIQLDGQPLALDGLRHANVAHFRVLVQDGKATAAGF